MRSVQASLDFHTEQFGPYPHRQLRSVEHAGHGLGLHAAPVNVLYLEGFSELRSEADPRDVDFPFAVAAHELAHQWWDNQLTPARVEGAPLLPAADWFQGYRWKRDIRLMRPGERCLAFRH